MALLERTFKVITDEGEIQRRLTGYAAQVGFISEDGRTYRRGIGAGRLLAAFPRNTPAELNVTWRRDPDDWQVSVIARILVGGRATSLTVADLEYWSAELDAVELALTGRTVDLDDLKRYAQSVSMRRLLIGLVILFFIVLGGTLARIIFQNPTAFWMGGVFGAMLGIGMAQPLARRQIRKPLSSVIKDLPMPPAAQRSDASLLELAMRRDIRSWGGWMIVMGVISFVSSGFLDSSWGILLVVVGLASLLFRTPALYIVYGVTLVWAAINNALLSSGTWAVFSIVQLFMAVQTFGQFRKFNQAYQAGQRKAAEKPAEVVAPAAELEPVTGSPETADGAAAEPYPQAQFQQPGPAQPVLVAMQPPMITPDPYAPVFSWLSLAMGIFGLFSLLAVLGFNLLQGMFAQTVNLSSNLISFLTGVAIDFCLLGFSAGLGSLLTRHRFKGASIVGLISGGLGVLLILVLMILARLG